MLNPFLKSLLERLSRNKTIAVLAVVLVLAIASVLYLFHIPRFPGNVPSAESSRRLTEVYQAQKKLYQDYTRFIRENHGGLVMTDLIEQNLGQASQTPAYATFLHRYQLFDKQLILSLTRQFATQQQLAFQVKHKKSSVKIEGLKDSYLVNFLRNEKLWVQVKIEILESSVSQQTARLALQYEENLESYRTDYVEEKVDSDSPVGVVPGSNGKLVIIIDDMGNNMQILHKLVSLDFDITYSVLPLLPYTNETTRVLHDLKREIMLHLPMEPKGWPKYNPGPGALFRKDDRSETTRKLEENLASVNYAAGVNNHMGSSYTQYGEGLDIVMEKLKSKNLFFVDSKTSPGHVVRDSARRYQVPYLARNIFLDNFQSEPYIKKQLYKAVRIAKRHGSAIAIGHPHLATYKVLAAQLPVIQKEGVKITRASELIRMN